MFNVENQEREVSQDLVGVFKSAEDADKKVECLDEARASARAQLKDVQARVDDVFSDMSPADSVVDEDDELISLINALRSKLRDANEFSSEADRHTQLAGDRFHNTELVLREASDITNKIRDLIN